jgi:hypothetical protein
VQTVHLVILAYQAIMVEMVEIVQLMLDIQSKILILITQRLLKVVPVEMAGQVVLGM